jgi:tRNA (mo5U34)-methyltransferase
MGRDFGEMTSTKVEVLREQVGSVTRWFHSIDLGGGIVTPEEVPHVVSEAMADIYFGIGIEGRSVLDVGAWDGFYSFEAERRGASRVLAADYFSWGGGGTGDRKAFELARSTLGSRVEDRIVDIPEMTVATVGHFDVVLFNGIVYHILNPVGALIQMAAITRQVLTVETYLDNYDNPLPAMLFLPGVVQPPGFPQNGWGPNSLFMHALLKQLGFETVLEFPTPGCLGLRSIFMAFKPGHPFGEFVKTNEARAIPRFTVDPSDGAVVFDQYVDVDELRRWLSRLPQRRPAIGNAPAATRKEMTERGKRTSELEREIGLIVASRSWHMTAPLRAINAFVRSTLRHEEAKD